MTLKNDKVITINLKTNMSEENVSLNVVLKKNRWNKKLAFRRNKT